MKKIKVVQNCLKCREHWSKTIFGLFSPPQNKFGGSVQKIFVKNEKNQSCSKLPEMGRKLVENEFWTFKAPNPRKKLGGVQHFFVKNEKNQSCSKLSEKARKLVKHDFLTF